MSAVEIQIRTLPILSTRRTKWKRPPGNSDATPSTCYQPLADQSPAASGDPALGFPPVPDFSNGKLSLSETVVEKMPTFAV
jgi:hypothetical protein